MDEAAKKKYRKMEQDSKIESEKLSAEMNFRNHEQPKRPGNSYSIFIQNVFADIREQNPNKQNHEIFALCSEKWSKMSEKQKEKYEKLYDENLEIFKTQMTEFKKYGFYYTRETKQLQNSRKRKSQKRGESSGKRPKKVINN